MSAHRLYESCEFKMSRYAFKNPFIDHECVNAGLERAKFSTNIYETYGQYNEDIIVDSLLRAHLSRSGRSMDSVRYVEIGGNHPVQTSSSYLFYRAYGARGVICEANPRLAKILSDHRPEDVVVNCAISTSPDKTVSLYVANGHELSSLNKDHIDGFAWAGDLSKVKEVIDVENMNINDFLHKYSSSHIDYLSIDIEGLDFDVLSAIDFNIFCPGIIQCEHEGQAQKFNDLLTPHGYVAVAITDGNMLFVDRTLFGPAVALPTVNTFDVFDTLIARRGIDPENIFREIEQDSGIADFARHRSAIMGVLARKPFSLEDIYSALAQQLNLSGDVASQLMALELEKEIASAIPITENLNKVRDGDVLISDMYLGEKNIRKLLDAVGFTKDYTLITSNYGKGSGRIWPKVLRHFAIGRHMGDHPESDVNVPRRFGISCLHTDPARPTDIEQAFLTAGCGDLGRLVRETRLATFNDNPIIQKLILAQISYNFPIFFFSSLYIERMAAKFGLDRILFSSRDCNLFIKLFSTLTKRFGHGIDSEYFYTSRHSRAVMSPDYRRYAKTMFTDRTLLVDICGTGASGSLLMDGLGVENRHQFLIDKATFQLSTQDAADAVAKCATHALVGPKDGVPNNMTFEMANYAKYGSVLDVKRIDNSFVPIFGPNRRTAFQDNAIEAQRDCFLKMVKLCDTYTFTNERAISDAGIKDMVEKLYRLLSAKAEFNDIFGDCAHSDHQEYMEMRSRVVAKN
jgi:FkbM family methyltransferase